MLLLLLIMSIVFSDAARGSLKDILNSVLVEEQASKLKCIETPSVFDLQRLLDVDAPQAALDGLEDLHLMNVAGAGAGTGYISSAPLDETTRGRREEDGNTESSTKSNKYTKIDQNSNLDMNLEVSIYCCY